LAARVEQAWRAARQAAQVLRDRFGATRVVVFGSLAQPKGFTRWSDVDLAAWGLAPRDTFRAMNAVADVQREIEMNLVDVGTCPAELLAEIERQGVDL